MYDEPVSDQMHPNSSTDENEILSALERDATSISREISNDSPRPRGRYFDWERKYAGAVVTLDIAASLFMVLLGHWTGLGSFVPQIGYVDPYLGLIAAVINVLCLLATRAWEPRILGQGSEEFSRLFRALATSAVTLGLLGLAVQIGAVRPWVFGFIPVSAALAASARFALRKALHRGRTRGQYLRPMLAVGENDSVTDLIERTRRDPFTGWAVVAACTPTGHGERLDPEILGVPVVGDLDSVVTEATSQRYRAVAIAPTPGWSGRRLHQLSWDLDGLGVDVVVDPGLMEIAGPRLHVTPVDNLPLLSLTQPTFTGVPRVLKYLVDRAAAALLLLLISPLLIVVSIVVRFDRGPVLFRQTRVGRNGETFLMVKFRTMVVDAEDRIPELGQEHDGSGPLFKLRKDPRVTPIGRLLRRYSLDELPQLFNVIRGNMSLVGPRPPLPSEVATYERAAQRRLLVKPGLTGLWQVSGRSDLSWEESVRLDLRYVENWTLALDALILWKTVGAVFKGRGAY